MKTVRKLNKHQSKGILCFGIKVAKATSLHGDDLRDSDPVQYQEQIITWFDEPLGY